MGARTKLPPGEEKRITEGGVELLLSKTARDIERENQEYLKLRREVEPKARPEEHGVSYAAFLTKQAQHDLAVIKSHELEMVQEKMHTVISRPTEIGDRKHGNLRGFKSVKVERVEKVLLFMVDESRRVVTFARYGDHGAVYGKAPNLEGELVSFELWAGGHH